MFPKACWASLIEMYKGCMFGALTRKPPTPQLPSNACILEAHGPSSDLMVAFCYMKFHINSFL